ncbi:MAG TPA: D-aminoacyl-tRNA deacylase [Anaerolineae bacterium]|jgi:D-aminoacyl-tRNA deacylase|nr:D-aminoacyl-tRNA deacylase [Anaerolineae bacterium]
MRVLLQRVSRAEVRVAGAVRGAIGAGLTALVGVGPQDTADVARALAAKSVDLRIFRDEEGRTNRSLLDVGGAMLVVSQFTLYGDTRKGRRPSFIDAARPELAAELVEAFAAAVETRGVAVGRGVFGAEMEVELVNDGPMTIWLDSDS